MGEDLEFLKSELSIILTEFPESYSAKVKANPELHHTVISVTDFLPPDIKMKTRIYRILHGLHMHPTCLNCGADMEDHDIRNMKTGYRRYCCPKCAKDSAERKRLYAETCARKYGVANASSCAEVKEKRTHTNLSRLGVDNPAKSPEVREKIRATSVTRYGSACVLQSEYGREKAVQTNLIKYGVTSYSKTAEYGEKTRASNTRRFGVSYPNMDPEFRRKSQKRYAYEGVQFDSLPELAFFIYARDHGAEVEYQPNVSFSYEFGGRVFAYQPDFRVGGRLVEIKGLHFFENRDPAGRMINPYDRSLDGVYEAKRQCMLRNGVEIVTDCSQYVSYVNARYGGGYMKGFKNA